MDATALWQRYQDWLYYHDSLGLYLDISRMGFDDDFVASLLPKFDHAFQAMDALEKARSLTPMKTAWSAIIGCATLTSPQPKISSKKLFKP
ncbi:MAG TPA: hypothetical protein V6D21_03885 [Candidatus Obscuribacterales bacterium]